MSKWQRTLENFSHLTDLQLRFLIEHKVRQASDLQSEAAVLKRVLKQRGKNSGN